MNTNKTSAPTMRLFGVSAGDRIIATEITTGICGLHSKWRLILNMVLTVKVSFFSSTLSFYLQATDLSASPTQSFHTPSWDVNNAAMNIGVAPGTSFLLLVSSYFTCCCLQTPGWFLSSSLPINNFKILQNICLYVHISKIGIIRVLSHRVVRKIKWVNWQFYS